MITPWILYCKTCKITVGWGDKFEKLLEHRHLSDTLIDVQVKNPDGTPMTKDGIPVYIQERESHECGVFFLAELPDIPHSKETDDLEKDFAAADKSGMKADEISKMNAYIAAQQEASKISERSLIINEECKDLMK